MTRVYRATGQRETPCSVPSLPFLPLVFIRLRSLRGTVMAMKTAYRSRKVLSCTKRSCFLNHHLTRHRNLKNLIIKNGRNLGSRIYQHYRFCVNAFLTLVFCIVFAFTALAQYSPVPH